MRACYYTLGCKLNYAETSQIADELARMGVVNLPDGHDAGGADICIVNTCSVTAEANKKCRQLIRQLRRRMPGAAIVVTGCYAQLCPDDVKGLPGVAIVAGNDRKGDIAAYVRVLLDGGAGGCHVDDARGFRRFAAACAHGDRTRYFLKVQDGCDCFCTYCTIPMARGRSRSATVGEMVEQARRVADAGGREIVITGVNIGDFGKRSRLGNRVENFYDLIVGLDGVDGIDRYRISSIEPDLLTDEIIDFVAGSRRFMPHFHIPLQAGCDATLRLMRRRYDTALFQSRIERIRQKMPDAFIGVDVIAGSRGESAEAFNESVAFIRSLDITRLHVFPYSERPGTRALEIPGVVSQHEKHLRVGELMAVSSHKLEMFSRRFVGSVRDVLLEHSAADGRMGGFTDNYLRVALLSPAAHLANTVVPVRLLSYDSATETMRGEIAE